MKASTPRDRIFVGQGFVVKPNLQGAVQYVELLLKHYPHMIAMLEFTSKGRNHRQIDCALVGPGGIDLIEIKNKHGVVRGTPEGEWTVTYRGRTEGFFNTKNGIEENPFNQARNTTDDLKDWIKKDLGVSGVWVSPTVWLPSADPKSVIERDSFVWHAIGNQALASKIRSATKAQSCWGSFNYHKLPELFALKPIDLTFVHGRVVEPSKHAGMPDIRVIVDVDGERAETCTDTHGQFDFSVKKGSRFTVSFAVPTSFVQPDTLEAQATLDYERLEPLILGERPPTKTEEQIREEEWHQVQQEVEARVNARLQRSQQEWSDSQAKLSMVIEDLQAQLLDTLLHLDDRERTLRKQLAEQKVRQERLPLPVQVQQATQAVQLQQQREQITEALERLNTQGNESQKQAVQKSLAVLTEVLTENRYALTQVATPALVMRPVKLIATTPVPLPDIDAPVDEDVNQPEIPSPAHASQPESIATKAASESIALEATLTPTPIPASRPRPLWPWLAGVVVIALGLGAFWQLQRGSTAQAEVVQPQSVSGTHETLPGVSVNDALTDDALPGVPVSKPKD